MEHVKHTKLAEGDTQVAQGEQDQHVVSRVLKYVPEQHEQTLISGHKQSLFAHVLSQYSQLDKTNKNI